MKRILVLLILAAVVYVVYDKYGRGGNGTSTEGYSLKTAADKPIPKQVFFALFTREALNKCSECTKHLQPVNVGVRGKDQ